MSEVLFSTENISRKQRITHIQQFRPIPGGPRTMYERTVISVFHEAPCAASFQPGNRSDVISLEGALADARSYLGPLNPHEQLLGDIVTNRTAFRQHGRRFGLRPVIGRLRRPIEPNQQGRRSFRENKHACGAQASICGARVCQDETTS